MRHANPFASQLAREHSSYAGYRNDELVLLLDEGRPASELAKFVHGQIYNLVTDARFSCLGAKAALNQGNYRFGMYATMGSVESTAGLCHDLYEFVNEQAGMQSNFTTFIASFSGPQPRDEVHFESLVWAQLQSLHDQDLFDWDPTVSSDPNEAQFSFSFAERAFYVVGLHAGSSRWIRKFAWPTLVFNAHYQFEHLRRRHKFERFQQVVRTRERRLQGSNNPSLADFGAASEAMQYSGRAVDASWKCPFERRPDKVIKAGATGARAAAVGKSDRGTAFDQLIDISMEISPSSVVYPEDPPIRMSRLCTIGHTSLCNITELGWTTHLLTHVDAPLHFVESGLSLDEVPLQRFCGDALVVEVEGDVVAPEHIPPSEQVNGTNLLFKTRNSALAASQAFHENHVYVSLEAAELAVERGANLIGIDYLSVDRYGDTTCPVHRTLLGHGVLILEGINLQNARAGRYTLVALPLRVVAGDGSPVRAILIPHGEVR